MSSNDQIASRARLVTNAQILSERLDLGIHILRIFWSRSTLAGSTSLLPDLVGQCRPDISLPPTFYHFIVQRGRDKYWLHILDEMLSGRPYAVAGRCGEKDGKLSPSHGVW
jgi:hypothetical protein